MIRPDSTRPIFDRVRSNLRKRIRDVLWKAELRPVRVERIAAPQIHMLEPRLVLNATAELTAVGELLVTGTPAAETVHLEVDTAGDLQLRDGAGTVIPIVNHPDDPANPAGSSNPLDPSEVTAGIRFEMGGDDDVLDLQLPNGLNVTVSESDGNDRANLRFASKTAPMDTVVVDSETITLNSSAAFVSIANDTVRLKGDLFFGVDGDSSQLDIGMGSLEVNGRFVLTGDVGLVGSGSVDMSKAVITASTSDTSLRVNLLQPATGFFSLKGADESEGKFVEDLVVDSANRVLFGSSPLTLTGDLIIRGVENETEINSVVQADAVSVVTKGDITINEAIHTRGDEITFSTPESLTVAGNLDTTLEPGVGAVNLKGSSIQLIDTQIKTAGGLVNVSGPAEINGDVFIDSGKSQTAATAGDVQFLGPVESDDASGDTLRIDARGVINGRVHFDAPVGASSVALTAMDLNGLDVQAATIDLVTVGVLDGNVRLSAEGIRLVGPEMRTTSSGDIIIDGKLLLPPGDTSISAAGRVQFSSAVKGQTGTRDLQVAAGTDALFEGTVQGVRNLNVMAQQQTGIFETLSLGGNLEVDADTIRIGGDVDTTFGSLDGDVRLGGVTLVSVEADALLFVDNGTIQVDGGGGVIDVGQSTLHSDAVGDAVSFRNASRLILGDVIAKRGNVTIGIGQDVRGATDQAPDTLLTIDRLTASTDGLIDLTNSGNEIRSIEQITSGGDIAIIDSVGDLSVAAVDSHANDVLLSTASLMFVAEGAITAIGATTTLSAGVGIVDRDDTQVANVQTGRLQLNAGVEGIGDRSNPFDVVASISASANTSPANGNIALASIGSPLPVGLIDAGRGELYLEAQAIDDATDDTIVDIIARVVTMNADTGIGNTQPLELMSVSELTAETDTGGIELDLEATSDTVVHQLSANVGNILVRHRVSNPNQTVELQSVLTGDGAITIDAGGTVTATSVVSNNASGSDDPGGGGGPDSRDVTLIARGEQSDLLVTTITALQGADVILIAGDDILDTDMLDDNLVTADHLRAIAGNQTGDQNESIELSTDVNTLVAQVDGLPRGDVVIEEVDSIVLESVTTEDGSITVAADGTITATSVFSNNVNGSDDLGGLGGPDSRDVTLTARGKQSDILVTAITALQGADVILVADDDILDTEMLDDNRLTADRLQVTALNQTNDQNESIQLSTSVNTLVARVESPNRGDALIEEVDSIVVESVITEDGSITIAAGGTITATSVVSNNTSGSDDLGGLGGPDSRDVTLTARGERSDILVTTITALQGADVILIADDDILDTDATDNNLVAADDLQLVSHNQSADQDGSIQLSTDINEVIVLVDGAARGDVSLQELNSILVASSDRGDTTDQVLTSNGSVTVTAGGDIEVAARAGSPVAIDAGGGGAVTLIADDTSDVFVRRGIRTANGQIQITGENITVFDNSVDNGSDLQADPELFARGANGRIHLEAASQIELKNLVQLRSEKVTQEYAAPATRPMPEDLGLSVQDRSIYLKSDSVVFGEQIELDTSVDSNDDGVVEIQQGIARIFSPRPQVPPDTATGSLPAFFDPESVTTNVLEQARVNDATGILTLDIGRDGERGLTIDIDWGAPNEDVEFGRPRRFQQINGLSADEAVVVGLGPNGIDPEVKPSPVGAAPLLSVEHFYSEASILNSTVNDRQAATSPLEVRFSVRHHESILVEASSVQQGLDAEDVPGGIVSSTDNPLTPRETLPGLENGEASFIIPNLTIPVAFVPVRDVIPEIEIQEFVALSEPTIALIRTAFEAFGVPTSSIIGSEEYFQIRVLSPDPDGDDLVDPERLPDNILEGDNIQKLFEGLPDGRYQIEYVFDDGYQRPILRVDVRGGEATMPSDELDEGLLRLEPIDADATDEQLPKVDAPNVEAPNVEAPNVEAPNVEAPNVEASDQSTQQSSPPLSDGAAVIPRSESEVRKSSLPPVAAGVLSSALQRRFRRIGNKRLSVAGRYAARSRASSVS